MDPYRLAMEETKPEPFEHFDLAKFSTFTACVVCGDRNPLMTMLECLHFVCAQENEQGKLAASSCLIQMQRKAGGVGVAGHSAVTGLQAATATAPAATATAPAAAATQAARAEPLESTSGQAEGVVRSPDTGRSQEEDMERSQEDMERSQEAMERSQEDMERSQEAMEASPEAKAENPEAHEGPQSPLSHQLAAEMEYVCPAAECGVVSTELRENLEELKDFSNRVLDLFHRMNVINTTKAITCTICQKSSMKVNLSTDAVQVATPQPSNTALPWKSEHMMICKKCNIEDLVACPPCRLAHTEKYIGSGHGFLEYYDVKQHEWLLLQSYARTQQPDADFDADTRKQESYDPKKHLRRCRRAIEQITEHIEHTISELENLKALGETSEPLDVDILPDDAVDFDTAISNMRHSRQVLARCWGMWCIVDALIQADPELGTWTRKNLKLLQDLTTVKFFEKHCRYNRLSVRLASGKLVYVVPVPHVSDELSDTSSDRTFEWSFAEMFRNPNQFSTDSFDLPDSPDSNEKVQMLVTYFENGRIFTNPRICRASTDYFDRSDCLRSCPQERCVKLQGMACFAISDGKTGKIRIVRESDDLDRVSLALNFKGEAFSYGIWWEKGALYAPVVGKNVLAQMDFSNDHYLVLRQDYPLRSAHALELDTTLAVLFTLRRDGFPLPGILPAQSGLDGLGRPAAGKVVKTIPPPSLQYWYFCTKVNGPKDPFLHCYLSTGKLLYSFCQKDIVDKTDLTFSCPRIIGASHKYECGRQLQKHYILMVDDDAEDGRKMVLLAVVANSHVKVVEWWVKLVFKPTTTRVVLGDALIHKIACPAFNHIKIPHESPGLMFTIKF